MSFFLCCWLWRNTLWDHTWIYLFDRFQHMPGSSSVLIHKIQSFMTITLFLKYRFSSFSLFERKLPESLKPWVQFGCILGRGERGQVLWAMSFLHRRHLSGWCSWDSYSITWIPEAVRRWTTLACMSCTENICAPSQLGRHRESAEICAIAVSLLPSLGVMLTPAPPHSLQCFLCFLRHVPALLVLGVGRVYVNLEWIKGSCASGCPVREYCFQEDHKNAIVWGKPAAPLSALKAEHSFLSGTWCFCLCVGKTGGSGMQLPALVQQSSSQLSMVYCCLWFLEAILIVLSCWE